jgi:hypothetical protein
VPRPVRETFTQAKARAHLADAGQTVFLITVGPVMVLGGGLIMPRLDLQDFRLWWAAGARGGAVSLTHRDQA